MPLYSKPINEKDIRKYKTTGSTTLFDQEDKERKLTKLGNPLERLLRVVDFEMFRVEL